MKLPAQAAHALIGKYVYLRYLRDRDILSETRLTEFQIDAQAVFSRKAQLSALRSLVDQLDDWLNGFGLRHSMERRRQGGARQTSRSYLFRATILRAAKGSLLKTTISRTSPLRPFRWSMSSSCTPKGGAKMRARTIRRFLWSTSSSDEMEASLPFTKGMRALDPACGSGAFLVQCYRPADRKRAAEAQGGEIPSGLSCVICCRAYIRH